MNLKENIMLLIFLILDNVSRETLVKAPTLNQNRRLFFYCDIMERKTYGTFRLTHISDIYNNIMGNRIYK